MTGYSFEDVLGNAYWRHRIDLDEEGKYTPGTKDTTHWEALGLPKDLSGKTFLDIGAFDGLHSFEAERRGAERVLATDVWGEPSLDKEWWDSLRPGKRGFEIARDCIGSDVEARTIGVENISPETVGKFDFVLMSGVIYHLKEPYRAIENALSVARERVVVESAVLEESEAPVMKFLRGKELDRNPSNWWQPSLQAVEDMVLAAGASETEAEIAPIETAERKTPELKYGKLKAENTVYRTPDLENDIDCLEKGEKITVLMERAGSVRIEYRQEEAKVQGWVSSESVEVMEEWDLSEDTSRGVVHGYL